MNRIVLASGSPRRKELLEQIGLSFTVVTSEADENIAIMAPEKYVKELALRKASAVKSMLTDMRDNKQACVSSSVCSRVQIESVTSEEEYITYQPDELIIIGADTVVSLNGEILTKPRDEADAKRMLRALSGNKHQVYTGVAVLKGDRTEVFAEKTDVFVAELDDVEIDEYVATGEPMDKAGAYGIQGLFAKYIDSICGDYNNVVGLPVAHLFHVLKEA